MDEEKKSLSVHGILSFVGLALVIIQIASFIGMSRAPVGLYPSKDDFFYSYNISRVEETELNGKMLLFAVTAGSDRFKTSFKDYSYDEDEYWSMSSTQMTSAMIRESLGCGKDGSTDLIIYDTVLTASYYFLGVVGIVLLILSGVSRVKEDNDMGNI